MNNINSSNNNTYAIYSNYVTEILNSYIIVININNFDCNNNNNNIDNNNNRSNNNNVANE